MCPVLHIFEPRHTSNFVTGGFRMSRKLHFLLMTTSYVQLRIDRERARRVPDWNMLLRLKVLRLRLNDRMRVLLHGYMRTRGGVCRAPMTTG